MNEPEYERMFLLEDSYWWFVGRHRLVEALLRSRYGAPGTQDTAAPLNFLDVCYTFNYTADELKELPSVQISR